MELTGEVRERDERATAESAKLNAVKEKLASVKAKLFASRVEGDDSRWSTHTIAKGASKVEDDVSRALIVVSGEVADATKQKLLSLSWS